MLDGQKLLNTTLSRYRSNDAVYQTEYNNFTRVRAQANDTIHGPKWFKAETKSGLVYEYGNSQASRQQINDNFPIMNWYVSKISDLFGNQINFSYIRDYNSVYPSEISYGPNTITFYYKQRSDMTFSLLSGAKIEQRLLLDKIVIKYSSSVIKTYEFRQSLQITNYNSYSALNEVVEYGTNSSRLNSTVFSYQNPANVSFSQTTYNPNHNYITYNGKNGQIDHLIAN
jgi:hypothetical protein